MNSAPQKSLKKLSMLGAESAATEAYRVYDEGDAEAPQRRSETFSPVSRKITALIPCYNEENGVASVIRSFPRERLAHHGFELEIIVIDNDSRDRTAEIALECGARVIHEPQRGKATPFVSVSRMYQATLITSSCSTATRPTAATNACDLSNY